MSTTETTTQGQMLNTLRLSTAHNSAAEDASPKKCGKCDKGFKSRDKPVKCSTCRQDFHAKCQHISERTYEAIKDEDADIDWYCTSCKVVTRNMSQNMARLTQRVTALETTIVNKADKDEVEKINKALDEKAEKEVVEQLSKKIDAMKQENNEKLDKDSEELSKLLEEKLKEQREIIEKNKTIQTGNGNKTFEDAVKEMEDRDRRKNNLIFHNIEESGAVNPDVRRAEDVSFIMKLLRENLKVESEIQTNQEGKAMVRRLGSKNANKPRSLMVTFRPMDVPKILKNAKLLANAKNEVMRKIVIKPDQTPFQRDEEKKLVKERNDRNQEAKSKNETADWIIQKGRVVRRSQAVPKSTKSTSTTTINEEFKDAVERS